MCSRIQIGKGILECNLQVLLINTFSSSWKLTVVSMFSLNWSKYPSMHDFWYIISVLCGFVQYTSCINDIFVIKVIDISEINCTFSNFSSKAFIWTLTLHFITYDASFLPGFERFSGISVVLCFLPERL